MLVAVLVLSGAVAGCSALAVVGAPEYPEEGGRFYCTQENYAPALDMALAGGAASGAVGHLIAASDADVLAVGVAVASAVGFAISAGYGYDATAECRQAKQHMGLPAPRDAAPAARAVDRDDDAAYAAPGISCEKDIQCPGAEVCLSGRCRLSGQPQASGPAMEPVCKEDSDCLDGYACEGGLCVEAHGTDELGDQEEGPERGSSPATESSESESASP